MADVGFMTPEKIASILDLKPNQVIADFGAGHGFFSIAFAKQIGSSGQVFAIDILPEALEAIRSRARLEGLFNIKVIQGNLEKVGGSTIPDNFCDLVFAANVLFQNPDKSAIIKEASRVLKSQGRLVIVEWHPQSKLGPQQELKIAEPELRQLAVSLGFADQGSLDAGSQHYGLIFKKP